jgi:hypothetical protein
VRALATARGAYRSARSRGVALLCAVVMYATRICLRNRRVSARRACVERCAEEIGLEKNGDDAKISMNICCTNQKNLYNY